MTEEVKEPQEEQEEEAALVIIEHKSLAEALLHAQAEYPPLEKGQAVNAGSFSYKYADLAHIERVTDPYLRKHGLVVNSKNEYKDGKEFCVSTLRHIHSDDTDISEIDITEPSGDLKLFGGNITYARRYNYCSLTGRIGEDSSETRDLRRPAAPAGANPGEEQGKANGGNPDNSIGGIKNRLLQLESQKKAGGMTQTEITEMRVKILGNMVLDHSAEKLTEYGNALALHEVKAKG